MRAEEYLKKLDALSDEEGCFNVPGRKEFVLERIGRGRRVLDIGCGGGRISRLIAELNNDVTGIEVNPRAAEEARRRGLRIVEADVEKGIPFGAGEFDAVHAGQVIEQLYDTRGFFLEVTRVLKEGGVFLFSALNLNSLENRMRVLTGNYVAQSGAYPEDHYGHHIRLLNLAKARDLCAQSGLQIEVERGIPALAPQGRLAGLTLGWMARVAPGFSPMLLIQARKRSV